MAPPRNTRIPPSLDIPVLTEEAEAQEQAPESPTVPAPAPSPPPVSLSPDALADLLSERIAALTDRLLSEASAEIHATLVNKVWEKLRDEIPAIVEATLKGEEKE